ncbi:MAG: hypothetical protein FRX48_07149 [Lasallia pustulata]|uniref:Uncharacterized protein n=1 Tax=Lasallia pustulata TaxID=136370 RepID=A0A5M8PHK5_9LECA|nr:MAG: hypothetical protein FRX48_07149 [Lasallia pustulata]
MENAQHIESTEVLPEPDLASFWHLDAQTLALASLQSIILDLDALQNHLWELRGCDFRARTLLPSGSLYNPAREFWHHGGQKYLDLMACLLHIISVDDTSKLSVFTSALSVAGFNLQPIKASLNIQQIFDVLDFAEWLYTKEKEEHFAMVPRAGAEDDEGMERTRADLIRDVTHLQALANEAKIGLMKVVGFVKHIMYGGG